MTEPTERLTFDFITDERFRSSLEADYAEMTACLENGSWKAALVLSGSIVEAILADYLLSAGQKTPDPLRMELANLVEAAHEAGVLDDRAKELSSVIRGFRNLIHPGRVVRLNERYGADDAMVAAHVVSIVVREVAARQVVEFGLTSEQLVSKFEMDPSASAIASNLLQEMRPSEVRRALLDIIPSRYFAYSETDDPSESDAASEVLPRLGRLYRAAFEAADESSKKAAVKRYVEVLRGESGTWVELYDVPLFRGTDLQFMTKAERDLVIAHLVHRLDARRTVPTELIAALPGAAVHLSEKQLMQYLDGFARIVAYDQREGHRKAAHAALATEFSDTTQTQDKAIRARLDVWIKFLRDERESPEAAARVEAIRDELDLFDDIPF